MMEAHTLLFDGSPDMYHRLADVLATSMAENSPSVPFKINRISDSDSDIIGRNTRNAYVQNARKTRHFSKLVQNSPNGRILLLLDCDLLCIRDAADLLERDDDYWDIALTYRNRAPNRYIFNTGVVAIRVSDFMKDWCRCWEHQAIRLLTHESEHAALRKKYGGINQSSLGYLIENRGEIRILKLSTTEWNSLPSNYPTCLERSHFIHLMGTVRSRLFNRHVHGTPIQRQITELWQSYSRRSKSHV